jgi:hypothetical protein
MGEMRHVAEVEGCSQERTEPFSVTEIHARLKGSIERGEVPMESVPEEKTEPFSQTEHTRRISKSIRIEEAMESAPASPVPLDSLKIEDHHHDSGVRILVRPLTPSRSITPDCDSYQWLALRAEVHSQDDKNRQHKVLAVTQTPRDIKFSVRIPGEPVDDDHRPPLWCELFYNPGDDNLIFLNRSDVPLILARMSQQQPAPSPSPTVTVVPGTTKAVFPGTWRILVRGMLVLDFRILEKRPASLLDPSSTFESVAGKTDEMVMSGINSSGKRSLSEDEEDAGKGKKARTHGVVGNNQEGVIVFLPRAADPLMLPLPNAVAVARGKQALLEVEKDQTVHIPGGCELDEYQLTKRDQIASTSLSSVYTAEHSQVPNGVVTVKVLKTRLPNPNAKTHENERNVIRQADMWLREYQSQDDLEHESIVKLYGGDSRHLALYMEHVEARDLSARDVWRSRQNDLFAGSRVDARRILKDISSALNYIHGRNLVHNDIKPANILYSPERGAVLCDFGLSSQTSNPASMGGTPYYVPPEFIGRKLRGTPSDVWALGITMLYVLRKISFPDARARPAHPRPLYWMIADLNRTTPSSHPRPGVQPMSAVSQMQTWLGEIDAVVSRLDRRDELERLVGQMLIPNPHQRITMERVLQELYVGDN